MDPTDPTDRRVMFFVASLVAMHALISRGAAATLPQPTKITEAAVAYADALIEGLES